MTAPTITPLRGLYEAAVLKAGKAAVLAELFKANVRHVTQLDSPGDREPELRALLSKLAGEPENAPAAEIPVAPATVTTAVMAPAPAAPIVVSGATPAGPAEELWLKGYDVVAIRAGEKRPFEKGWTKRERLDRDAAQRIDRERHSVGIRTGTAPGCTVPVIALDIDVTDAALAAELTAHALDHFGPAPVRTGRPPKALLVYRTDEPLRKHRLAFTVAGTEHAIELLATGQQFVSAGVHPDTRRPYTWDHALPPAQELTSITAEQIREYFETALKARGIEVTTSRASTTDRANVDQAELRAPSLDDLRELVRAIDNDTDYDTWVADLAAIKAAAGPEQDEAFEIAWEYSERWVGGVDSDELREKWESLRPPFAVGWGYLLDRARKQGRNTAPFEFTPVQPSVPSIYERMVSLSGDTESVFLAALSSSNDPSELWAKLQAAKGKSDPLAGVYSIVLDAALSVSSGLRGAAFRAAVTNRLLRHSVWTALSSNDKELVLRTVELLLRRSVGPRSPIILRDLPQRQWLVDELLARDGVGSITGAPNVGKSYLALYLAFLVAKQGGTFGTHAVANGGVFYFTSEGEHELDVRRKRLEAAYGPAPRLVLFSGVPDFSAPAEEAIRFLREAQELAGFKPDLIVVDVFTAAIPGANENEAWTVGAAMQRARLLGKLFKCAVLLVHHASKANPEDARGSSAFSAEVDVRFSVVSNDRGIRVRVEKNRSGPKGEELWFHLSDGGLLQPGPRYKRSDEYDTDIGAAVVGCLVHELREATDAIVKEHLSERWPEHFGKGASGVRQRYGRVKGRALELKYIKSQKGRFVPGEVLPTIFGELPPVEEKAQ